MQIISIKERVILKAEYGEISMISSTLGVPNHAGRAPDFETNVGAAQSAVDELGNRLWSIVERRQDFPEYHRLALKSVNREEFKKFNLEISLSKEDIILLAKAFKEASEFTREFDDFNTLTGHDWAEAVDLQRELDALVGQL